MHFLEKCEESAVNIPGVTAPSAKHMVRVPGSSADGHGA